ncbi:MAG: FIST N-terminal domain-containing protein [Actinomycetota bacterium]
MQISTGWSTDADGGTAVRAAADRALAGLNGEPDWIVAFPSVGLDPERVAQTLAEVAGDVSMHAATSCLGAMTAAGFHSEDGRGVGVFALSDPAGSYGTAVEPVGDDPAAASSAAVLAALTQAGRPGEQPLLIWLSAVPGSEEAVLAGLHAVVGSHTPIAGGSAADNTIAGEWRQFSGGVVLEDHVVVSVLFPSTRVHQSFHSGYLDTEVEGTVTRSDGRRLYEIDGRPAGEVYADWADGDIDAFLPDGGNILAASTMHPLGRRADGLDGEHNYVLAHPASLHADGSIDLFADIADGDRLIRMRGTSESLVSRAGRVATSALRSGGIDASAIAGALVVYCAGCMLAVQDEMEGVVQQMRGALSDAPFLGTFTFGEQGCFVGGDNYHGNLMISVVVFEA